MPDNFSDTLNHTFGGLFKAAVEDYQPIEYKNLEQGVQILPERVMAYALNKPLAGSGTEYGERFTYRPDVEPNMRHFILRQVVGYAFAARLLPNVDHGTLQVCNLINAMLIGAHKAVGNDIVRATFARAGSENEFFRELEDAPGYEIRLWGEYIYNENYQMPQSEINLDKYMEDVE